MVGQDGAEMVLVPAGEFPMGSEDTEIVQLQSLLGRLPPKVLDRLTDQAPRHQVYLDAFYIDKYEVTNALYARFVQATRRLASRLSDKHQFNQPQQPVVGVTWHDAQAYCTWAGKRLPTEAEWEKAARGPEGRIYPWGNSVDGVRMNYCDKRCPFRWKDTASDDGYARTAPVGSYEQGKSPYGAYDMAGNVWEWVADWYAADYYQHSPAQNPPGPAAGERKIVRGGAWFVPAPVARTATRQHFGAYYWGDNIGLRCALTPQ
jgi:iron(II)-dependent oxidoreductase